MMLLVMKILIRWRCRGWCDDGEDDDDDDDDEDDEDTHNTMQTMEVNWHNSAYEYGHICACT